MQARPVHRDPWPWLGVACALALVVLMTLVVRSGGLVFDEPFTAFVQRLPIPAGLWEACTSLGDATQLLPVAIAIVLATALTGRLRLALILAVALVAATLLTDVLKDSVARPRPPGAHLVTATGYSFPSGHALRSTVVYGVLAVLVCRTALASPVRTVAVAAAVTLPLLIGLARIALGVHYPSDVLAGWLAGIAIVAAAATLVRATRATRRDWPRRTVPPPTNGS